jgi:hypothetical protein
MKKCLLALLIVLLASNVWAVPTIYRHIEPETVSFFTNAATTATSTQFQVNENIKKVKYGGSVTLTGFTCDLSGVTGAYFVSNPSVDLTQYIGLKVNLNTGGKNLTFWPFNAGTGETLDVEKLVDPGFADATKWTVPVGWTVAANIATGVLVTDYLGTATTIENIGALYKLSFDLVTRTDGSVRMVFSGTPQSGGFTVPATYSIYRNLVGYYPNYSLGGNGFSGTCDNASLKQVLNPSATGVTITSTIGGPTGGWTMDSGFNLNATSFTVTVSLQ